MNLGLSEVYPEESILIKRPLSGRHTVFPLATNTFPLGIASFLLLRKDISLRYICSFPLLTCYSVLIKELKGTSGEQVLAKADSLQ